MGERRSIEVFSAGCPVCTEMAERIRQAAGAGCEVVVRDMHKPEVAARAQRLGVRSLPAVAIDGELAACCRGAGPDLEVLRAAGLGACCG
ncbi:MAG: hypothetical protein KatS3mg102_2327 [Planctomycetota bacterium]|nr:MAG: hypothetical protein KatS3mg102_2327 [Planctomycetota bacterium]